MSKKWGQARNPHARHMERSAKRRRQRERQDVIGQARGRRRGSGPGRTPSACDQAGRQERRHCAGPGIRGTQHGLPQGHRLRHLDHRTVSTAFDQVTGHVDVHARMHMQRTRRVRPPRACMGMDERRHRLQGHDEPEYQRAKKPVGHCRNIPLKTERGIGPAGPCTRCASCQPILKPALSSRHPWRPACAAWIIPVPLAAGYPAGSRRTSWDA